MRRQIAAVMLAGLAMTLVSCGDDDAESGSTASTEGGDGGAATGDPIRVGALLELSGPAAAFGRSSQQALEVAVEGLNEAGGVTIDGTSHLLELVVVDNETDPSAGVAGAQELTVDEGVDVIFGPVTGGVAPPVAQAVTARGVLLISDSPTLHELIAGDLVESPQGNLIFRTLYPPDVQGEIAAAGIIEMFPDVERVAFVLPDDASGHARSNARIIEVLEEEGIEVVAEEYVPATATDFQTVLTSVRAADPDLLWLCCTPGTVSGMMRQSVELGIDAAFMNYSGAPLSVALRDAIGEQVPVDAGTVYLPSVLEQLPSGEILTAKPGVEAFAADLEAAGHTIDSASGLGLGFFYDAVALLAAAMEQAGTFDDTEAIAAALEEVTVEGANGTIGFGASHEWAPPAGVCVARAGQPRTGVHPDRGAKLRALLGEEPPPHLGQSHREQPPR